tara:strand:+ start:1339 stop:2178 length:840 start_codon:yes stop_codon:yes gene_type:complete
MGFWGEAATSLAAQSDSALSTVTENFFDTDPTLATCAPAEANIRNQIPFATLRFSFPTTATETRLSFPAYLTAFSENFSPQWNEMQAFGRADPIPIYKNTSRSVTLGFSIPNYDAEDANENLKKLNMMIKSLYPGYTKLKTGAVVLASPPLTRIKFANLLVNHTNPHKGLLGYIKSFSTDFGIQQRGVFMQASVPGKEAMFPRVLQFNISFQPLHESPVGWNVDKKGGQFLGGRDYPYRTTLTSGDIAQAAVSAVTDLFGESGGMGERATFGEILGSSG